LEHAWPNAAVLPSCRIALGLIDPYPGKEHGMKKIYHRIASAYFTIATLFLMLLALILLLAAFAEVVIATVHGDVTGVLDGAGLVIIGFAVIETAKFIAEEEILRSKELRSAVESRRSLTKFITIIVIASSLEALVMVFKTGRDDITNAVYPAALFLASMAALVGLGAYQWLSSRIAYDEAAEREVAENERVAIDEENK
jgi:uncharacterized membrane protein